MTVVLGDQQPRRPRRRTISGDGSLHSSLRHLDPMTSAAQANQQEHTLLELTGSLTERLRPSGPLSDRTVRRLTNSSRHFVLTVLMEARDQAPAGSGEGALWVGDVSPCPHMADGVLGGNQRMWALHGASTDRNPNSS